MENHLKLIGMDRDQRMEALRYCVERVRRFWPDCYVLGPDGQQYARLERHLPDQVQIKQKLDAGRFTTLELALTPEGIRVRSAKPIREVADHVLNDPVWGPDWEVRHGKA